MKPMFDKSKLNDILTANTSNIGYSIDKTILTKIPSFTEATQLGENIATQLTAKKDITSLLVDFCTIEESISKRILISCMNYTLSEEKYKTQNSGIESYKGYYYTNLNNIDIPNMKPLKDVIDKALSIFNGTTSTIIIKDQESADKIFSTLEEVNDAINKSKNRLANDILGDASFSDFNTFAMLAYNTYRSEIQLDIKLTPKEYSDRLDIATNGLDITKGYESKVIECIKALNTIATKISLPVSAFNIQVGDQVTAALEVLKNLLFCYACKYLYKSNLVYAAKADAIDEYFYSVACPTISGTKYTNDKLVADNINNLASMDSDTINLIVKDGDKYDIAGNLQEALMESFDDNININEIINIEEPFDDSAFIMESFYDKYNIVLENSIDTYYAQAINESIKSKLSFALKGEKSTPDQRKKAVSFAIPAIKTEITNKFKIAAPKLFRFLSPSTKDKSDFIKGDLSKLHIATFRYTNNIMDYILKISPLLLILSSGHKFIINTCSIADRLTKDMHNKGINCRIKVTVQDGLSSLTGLTGDIFIYNTAGSFINASKEDTSIQEGQLDQMAQSAMSAIKDKANSTDATSKFKHAWAIFLQFMDKVLNKFQTSMDTRIKNGTAFLNSNADTIKANMKTISGEISINNYQQGINNITNIKLPPIQQFLTNISNTVPSIEDIEKKVFPQFDPNNADKLTFVDYAKLQFVGGTNKSTQQLNSLPIDQMIGFCKNGAEYNNLVNSISNDIKAIDQAISQQINTLDQQAIQAKQQQQQNKQTTANGESTLEELKNYISNYLEAEGNNQPAKPEGNAGNTPVQNTNSQQQASNNGNTAVKDAMSINITNKDGNQMKAPAEKSPQQQAIANITTFAANYQLVTKLVHTAKMTAYENIYVNYMNILRTVASSNTNAQDNTQQNNNQ
jgi:predicted DNA-binding ArsR family transcriptional regulator